MKRRIFLLSIFAVSLLMFSAYSNTFESPFILDDFHSFVNNPEISIQGWSWETFLAMGKTKFGIWRWLPMASLAMDFHAGGGKVLSFHMSNLVIHWMMFFSVYMLMVLLWKAHAKGNESSLGVPRGLLAIAGAALWALNPVQSTAVTYIVQRMASLQALFYVMSTACFVAVRLLMSDGRKGWRVWALSLLGALCALCALLSKENSFILPVMIIFTEIWFFNGEFLVRLARVFRERPVWAAIGCLLLLLVIVNQLPSFIETISSGYANRHFSLPERLFTEARLVLWYISLFFWPDPSRLSLEHDVIISTSVFAPISTFFSLVVLGWILIFVWFFRHRYSLITYGLAWYFVNLVIESSVIPLELIFEHRLYLPSVGLALSAIALCTELSSRLAGKLDLRQKIALAWAFCMICGALLSLLTFSRNEVWSNPLSVYGDSVKKAPLHPRAWCNYGKALLQEGRFQESLEASEKAITLGKDKFEHHLATATNVVLSLMELGSPEEAAQRGEYYLNNKPKLADEGNYPHLLLVIALANQRAGNLIEAYEKVDEAMKWMQRLPSSQETRGLAEVDLRQIVESARVTGTDVDGDGNPDPGDLSTDTWMAKAFYKWGETDMSEKLLRKAVQNPDDAMAREMLASIEDERIKNLIASQDWGFEKKYIHNPFSRHNALVGAAYLLSKLPYLSDSSWWRNINRSLLEKALTIDPNSVDVKLLLAWQEHAEGNNTAAVNRVRNAISERPEYARAWIQLGFFLMDAPAEGSAAKAFREGLRLYPGYPKRAVLEKIISEEQGAVATLTGSAGEEAPVSRGAFPDS